MNIFDDLVSIDGKKYHEIMQIFQYKYPYEHQEYSCLGTKRTFSKYGYQNKYNKNIRELICHTFIDNEGVGNEHQDTILKKPYVALFSGENNFAVFFRFENQEELDDFVENIDYINKEQSGIYYARMSW